MADLQQADAPDVGMIRTFAEVVFVGMAGLAPVRLLPEKGASKKPNLHYPLIDGELADALACGARKASAKGLGCFVVPGAVAGRRAKKDDVLRMVTVLVDLDEGDIPVKRRHLLQYLGKPTLEVASGGINDLGHHKLHLYWRLSAVAEGSDLVEARRLRQEVAARVGGDTSFDSLHQPIRVAGSIYRKGGAEHLVGILAANGPEHELRELARRVDGMPALARAPSVASGSDRKPSPQELMSRQVRAGAVDGVTRFGALSSVMGYFIGEYGRGRLPLDDAWSRGVEYNKHGIVPPWPQDRLRREFGRILDLDARKRGLPGEPGALSEDALAARFSHEVGEDYAFVPQWGRWLRWSGQVYTHDAEGRVREVIRGVCRACSAQAPQRDRRRLGAANTFAAIERIARSDPRHVATAEMWDADPEALNTPGGIIDLRTGELRAHAREARMSRIAHAAPAGDCPLWLQFLAEVTGNDEELAGYLCRLTGYCLTGLTCEHAFFFFHGGGANGKSTFVSVLRGILGDYATSAPIETFVASFGERHPTDLAGLAGARLVTAFETEEGRRWTESKIKAVTGGDPIKARFLRQDFFEYTPQFKLIILGNHKPPIRSFDDAMRRRVHLVPFEVTIPPERRLQDYAGTLLRAESGGILNWALAGLMAWRQIGLAPPAAVVKATEHYFEEEDAVGQWLRERCERHEQAFTSANALFSDWRSWAEAAGEPIMSQNRLSRELARRGIPGARTSRLRGFDGIRLRRGDAAGRGAEE